MTSLIAPSQKKWIVIKPSKLIPSVVMVPVTLIAALAFE